MSETMTLEEAVRTLEALFSHSRALFGHEKEALRLVLAKTREAQQRDRRLEQHAFRPFGDGDSLNGEPICAECWQPESQHSRGGQ